MKKTLYKAKTSPLPHQLEATNFLVQNSEAALFDEQGVGKTKEVIDAVITILKQKKSEAALIICPKTLMHVWQNEIKKHSYLIPVVIEGVGKTKGYKFLSFANMYIINYEGVKAELDIIKLLLEARKCLIVLDESQRIKDPDSQTFKAINAARELVSRRIILTGTPVANKAIDLWSQFYFLDGGKTLGEDFGAFKKDYKDSNLTKEKLAELQAKIRPKSIRRLKDDVLELPEKIYKTVLVELSPRQNEIYKKLKEELLIEIVNTDEKVIIDEAKAILKKLLRLVQVASNPGLLIPDYQEVPCKFTKLDELLKEIMESNEKVIIWSSFVGNVKTLRNRYRGLGSLNIHGEIPILERNKFIQLFQEDPDYRVMVANPAAAREGITLTAANNAIYIDRSFNLVDYLQSQDRIHRISQDKRCNIIKLVAQNTIDLFIEDKLIKKQDIARVIQGDIDKIDESSYLTKEEIIELLH